MLDAGLRLTLLLVTLFVCTQCLIPMPQKVPSVISNLRIGGSCSRVPRPKILRAGNVATIRCAMPSAAFEEAWKKDAKDTPKAERLPAVARALLSRKLDKRALQAAVDALDMDSIGPTSLGWGRCRRLTQIPLMETKTACVSVLLIPSGETVAPHDRPVGEVMCVKALQGEVDTTSWKLKDSTSKSTGEVTRKEIGFHKAEFEDDCVCRGGMCPRREGCKFWVELMRERLLLKQSRDAHQVLHVTCTPKSKSTLLDSGRGHVIEYHNVGNGVAVLIECVYSGGLDGKGTKTSPTATRWYRSASLKGKDKDKVMTLLPTPPQLESPSMGAWTGADMAEGIPRPEEGTNKPPLSVVTVEAGGRTRGGESLMAVVQAGGSVQPGVGEAHRWANFLDKISQIQNGAQLEERPVTEPAIELQASGGMTYTTATLPGERNGRQKVMQDAVTSGPLRPKAGEHVHAFAVYDGHGRSGNDVSCFLKLQLSDDISKKCLSLADTDFKQQQLTKEIEIAFETTNSALYRSELDCSNSGSTACVCLIADTKQGRKLITANVGDSRAILGRRSGDGSFTHAIPITWDQKPGLKKERERIMQEGGSVGVIEASLGQIFWLDDSVDDAESVLSRELGVTNEYLKAAARVFIPGMPIPGLACSRSFGDESVEFLGVTAVPEIEIRDLCKQDKFVVVATDGLWEVLTNQEVVDIVVSHGGGERAGAALVERAVELWKQRQDGSYRDDVSVIIIQLG